MTDDQKKGSLEDDIFAAARPLIEVMASDPQLFSDIVRQVIAKYPETFKDTKMSVSAPLGAGNQTYYGMARPSQNAAIVSEDVYDDPKSGRTLTSKYTTAHELGHLLYQLGIDPYYAEYFLRKFAPPDSPAKFSSNKDEAKQQVGNDVKYMGDLRNILTASPELMFSKYGVRPDYVQGAMMGNTLNKVVNANNPEGPGAMSSGNRMGDEAFSDAFGEFATNPGRMNDSMYNTLATILGMFPRDTVKK
jgi:hypothetical protein